MRAWTEIILVVGLLAFMFHIWVIIDVLRTPANVWSRAGQNQIVWAIVVLFLSLIGPLLYLAIARPQLRAARHDPI